jgi:hypothetical protein
VSFSSLVGGSGYLAPPSFVISGGSGTGLALQATLSAGTVTGIQVVSGGVGYQSAPTVTMSYPGGSAGGGGSLATATAVLGTSSSVDVPANGVSGGNPIRCIFWFRDTTVKP